MGNAGNLPGKVVGSNALVVALTDETTGDTAEIDASGALKVSQGTPGVLTASAPATGSVGVTSASLVAANASRRGLVIVNLSVNTVSFGIGQAAELNKGISLTQNGVWEMDAATFSLAQIFAIASAGSSTVSVQEFT